MGVWIFLPVRVETELSRDGKSFIPLGVAENDISPQSTGPPVKKFVVKGDGKTVRFVHFTAKNRLVHPEWHPGAGGKCWVFVDEIIVIAFR